MSSAVVYFFHALDFLCVCVCVSLITCATLWDGAIFYCSMQEKKLLMLLMFFFLVIEKKINCKLKS